MCKIQRPALPAPFRISGLSLTMLLGALFDVQDPQFATRVDPTYEGREAREANCRLTKYSKRFECAVEG